MVGDFLAVTPLDSHDQAIREYLITSGVIVLLMAVAAYVFTRLGRWINKSDPEVSAGDELARFRELYESGELDREEYDRIKAKLGKRLRKELDLPEVPDKPAAPQAPGVDERIQPTPKPPDAPPERSDA
jgi:hypothetical protein